MNQTGIETSLINNSRKRISIKEVEIDVLKKDVLEYAKNINVELGRIKDIVDETKNYYQSKSGDSFRKSFHENDTSLENIVLNIENIARGLNDAKSQFASKTEKTVEQLTDAINKIA